MPYPPATGAGVASGACSRTGGCYRRTLRPVNKHWEIMPLGHLHNDLFRQTLFGKIGFQLLPQQTRMGAYNAVFAGVIARRPPKNTNPDLLLGRLFRRLADRALRYISRNWHSRGDDFMCGLAATLSTSNQRASLPCVASCLGASTTGSIAISHASDCAASLAPAELTGQMTVKNTDKPQNHREKRCQVLLSVWMLAGNKERCIPCALSFCRKQAQHPEFQIECSPRMFEASTQGL